MLFEQNDYEMDCVSHVMRRTMDMKLISTEQVDIIKGLRFYMQAIH